MKDKINLLSLLKEVIDIYNPEELASKEIDYEIRQKSTRRFSVNLKYKDEYYSLHILPIFNQKRPAINFGSTDRNYTNINLNKLLNSKYSLRILAAIFGLIRYWIDTFDIQAFEYIAEGKTRNELYNYYLNKHFKDFKNYEESYGEQKIQVWKKI